MDLKDVYNKKTKKTLEGLQYPLEDSKITVMVQASDEITSVRAYTQRCIEAAIKTHDTIGRATNRYFNDMNIFWLLPKNEAHKLSVMTIV